MQSHEIRKKFLDFIEKQKHAFDFITIFSKIKYPLTKAVSLIAELPILYWGDGGSSPSRPTNLI